jgi:hypothetical protein
VTRRDSKTSTTEKTDRLFKKQFDDEERIVRSKNVAKY